MKKLVLFICLLVMPVLVMAKEYIVQDLTIDIGSSWEVYTRDNVIGNQLLEERGLDGRDVLRNMQNTMMYVDMLRIEGNEMVEGFVFIKEVGDEVMNLHKYDDKQVLEVGEKAYGEYDPSKIKIYETNGYKYVYVEYIASQNGTTYGIIDYYTVINGRGYTFKFQSAQSLTNYMDGIQKMIDSVKFKVEEQYEKDPESKSLLDRLLVPIVVGGVSGAIGGLGAYVNNKKKKEQASMYQQMPQPMMNQPVQQPNVMNNQPIQQPVEQQQVFSAQDAQEVANNYNNNNNNQGF